MKVKINKPVEWFGPYQLAGLLRYFGVSEDRCHEIGGKIGGEVAWLMRVCEWIYKKRQEWNAPVIRIDRWDTWSMDTTLAPIILPMLKQLRDTKHGSPVTMPAFAQTSDSAQLCFDFYDETSTIAWEAGHQQWKDILDDMIWAFEQMNTDWEAQYWKTHPEIDLTEYPEDVGKDSTPLRWKVEGECDWEGMQAHEQRIQRGVELFGKYFGSLWS